MPRSTRATSKKKTTRRKRKAKPKKRKKPTPKAVPAAEPDPPHPDNPDTRAAVWECYAEVQSALGVAKKLGIQRWIVREILASDRARLMAIIDGSMERLVAKWEQAALRGQQVIEDVLGISEALIREIYQAAAENRITNIRDQDGYPMPVLDATQFLIMSKLLSQVAHLSQQAHQISMAYRAGVPLKDQAGAAGEAGGPNIEDMDDAQLAQAIRAGGMPVPPILAKKVALLEKKDDAADPDDR